VTHHVGMRFSINIPNFGDFADARTVATVATGQPRRPVGPRCLSGITSCTTNGSAAGSRSAILGCF
jgi:hypothetical protein